MHECRHFVEKVGAKLITFMSSLDEEVRPVARAFNSCNGPWSVFLHWTETKRHLRVSLQCCQQTYFFAARQHLMDLLDDTSPVKGMMRHGSMYNAWERSRVSQIWHFWSEWIITHLEMSGWSRASNTCISVDIICGKRFVIRHRKAKNMCILKNSVNLLHFGMFFCVVGDFKEWG